VELISAMGIDLLEFWAALVLAALVPISIWSREVLSAPRFWASVAASGLLQLPTLAAIVWTIRFRAWMPLLIGLGLSIYYGALPMVAAWHYTQTISPRGLVLGACGGAAVGALVIADGFGRWCRMEMG
jgi:hypothetical protein